MAEESGIETPVADDLVRIDRTRKDKKLSNADWVSKTDPEAKIARMKDGAHIWPTNRNTPSISTPAP